MTSASHPHPIAHVHVYETGGGGNAGCEVGTGSVLANSGGQISMTRCCGENGLRFAPSYPFHLLSVTIL